MNFQRRRSLHVLAKDENFMTMAKETFIFLLRRNDLVVPSGLLTEKTVIELYKYFSSAKEDR